MIYFERLRILYIKWSIAVYVIVDIELTGSVESNAAGGSYGTNIFDMFILGIQSTYHTYSHEFKVTLRFTRFNLDPLTGGDICGVEGDYVELFNASSLGVIYLFILFINCSLCM